MFQEGERMITGLKQMRCGNCGHDTFKLFTSDEAVRIGVECQGCQEVSWIQPEPARLTIEFGENSDGRLTVY